ncbi:protein GVQW3-like [Watersipora subatra]|uniref:protein GVQW3-like n=1 Tax=Watersipora subatra TaxID=2589382 RepID=UPI00355B2E54
MNEVEEQRVCVKFCVKLGKSGAETLQMLRTAYGDSALKKTACYEWHKKIREGRTSTKDDDRMGRPATSRTTTATDLVRQQVMGNRRLTIREISAESGLSYGTCHLILTKDLGMRRISAKMVPKLLTDDQKEKRVSCCIKLKDALTQDPDFISKVVTGDESWVYGYDPETKSQSSHWKSPGSPRPKKARMSRSNVKTLLITFFDIRGVVHSEFLPHGQTVNQHVYKDILIRLRDSIRRKRRDLWLSGDWYLHHDNAPAHTSLMVRQYLAKNKVTVLNHPPYSPDLAPCDFYLFPKVKLTMKGERFDDIPTIQENVTRQLRSFMESDFQHCMDQWKRRWDKCIASSGD